MLACHETDRGAPQRLSGRALSAREAVQCRLDAGEILFHAGDERTTLYRVESGALCHYVVWDDGHHDVIEYAFAGDIVGLGHLDTYVSTTQAMTATKLAAVARDELARALRTDARLAMRLAAAADLEFEVAKSRALRDGMDKPMARVAAYLLVAANAGGQSVSFIPNAEITSAWTAEALNLSVGALTGALAQLESRGLVAGTPAGLKLENVAGLEVLAGAA